MKKCLLVWSVKDYKMISNFENDLKITNEVQGLQFSDSMINSESYDENHENKENHENIVPITNQPENYPSKNHYSSIQNVSTGERIGMSTDTDIETLQVVTLNNNNNNNNNDTNVSVHAPVQDQNSSSENLLGTTVFCNNFHITTSKNTSDNNTQNTETPSNQNQNTEILNKSSNFNLKSGRPNLEETFKQMAVQCNVLGVQRVAVVVCGPVTLVSQVAMLCGDRIEGVAFDIQIEEFNL